MKLLIALVTVAVVGCAGNQRPAQSRAISYEQLQAIKVSNRDCPVMDQKINFIEQQLQFRGLTNMEPEQLNEDDRKYNATARIIIWSLRIGCNNPGRYSQ